MNDPPNLISLPLDILSHLSRYLSPHDLLVLSATCRYLRSAFNDDWYWRKYTHGGHISEALDATTSLVEPVFTNSQTIDSLEPLCQHRLHFLKQSRLLNNLREGKFFKHSINYDGFISDLESTNLLCGQQKTYKGIYLFTIDYLSATSTEEAIKVFNIEGKPCLISTFKLLAHEEGYSVVIGFEIVGDKLVVKQDDWFDVYQIQVPLENFDVLHSIHLNKTFVTNSSLVVGNCLFVDNGPSNLHTWDIDSGETLGIVNPTNEQKANVLCFSEDRKHILFYIQRPENVDNKQDLTFYAYDILLKKFNYFSVPSSRFLYNQENLVGLVDSKYVVLLCRNQQDLLEVECSITVYNYVDSNLVVQHEHFKGCSLDNAKIIKSSYLLLPLLFSVKVMDILTLETIWELNLDCSGLIPEIPDNYIVGLEYINRSNLCEILLVHKLKERELWDLEKRKRFLCVDSSYCLGINEHCSKIITCGNGFLNVYSFW